ncbi:MAG: NAD(P)-dependent glycerol-3-phosphate dehydrogenase [Methylococcales symbiont of Hymedesmia sp. n. MRB-2018]|nr:MAG: NAD(P)-dependent glycerol-3-phosphate dehydrogenase [Methylococcales symbiont of Hymedesmia sp. n. MRB-2018]KAF3984361.1 MAG: NAD(P)-dependent glycerol-3-phosphate dehydrogenase [Methylococcales symbiont of Hymedesmia sp. n. MRB-2018]
MSASISILGAGSWGTALAVQAAKNACQTMLWGHNPKHILDLSKAKENKHYLPGLKFPASLKVTDDLEKAARFSSVILISVPSHAFKTTLLQLKPYIDDNTRIAWATKGFDPENGQLLHQIVNQSFPNINHTAVLSGPTFAQEVATGLPAAITIASLDSDFSSQLASIFHNSRFRAYTSEDMIAVQVGGAVKNVLAIAAGIADGLGFGANTRAALITRGLQEIIRLGVKLGGQPETFMGLAGLGDLILTCTDNQSRNRRFGLALGEGKNKGAVVKQIAQEIEGISAARETYLLSIKYKIEMPIIEQTYKVLYEDLAPLTAVQNLLGRDPKAES